MPYYLPISGERIIGFIPFPSVLVLCEMQSVLSRIWTRVAVSISNDDYHYTTGTSLLMSHNDQIAHIIHLGLFQLIQETELRSPTIRLPMKYLYFLQVIVNLIVSLVLKLKRSKEMLTIVFSEVVKFRSI